MTDWGQVKVTVLVYEGDLSFGGWATLVQSYLHHLQLHIHNDTDKYKGEGEQRSEEWTDDKRSGKKGGKGVKWLVP